MTAELKKEIEGASVVLVGSFNPAIISPGWLLANGLIGKEEANEARPEIIIPDISIFTAAWLRAEVTHERMLLSSAEPQEFERVRDLAVGILNVLEHTPVALLGLNHEVHIAATSVESWHKIGDILAPKEVWEPELRLPGTRNVTIEGQRSDQFAGHVQVTVQPSVRVYPGIYIAHNDHYILRTVEKQPQTREDFGDPELAERKKISPSPDHIPIGIKILTEKWADSLARSEAVFRKVMQAGEL